MIDETQVAGPVLDRLDRMPLEALREEWQRRFGPPPPLRSLKVLRLMLAWRIQADAEGGLDPHTRKLLRRTGAPEAEGRSLGIGTKLRREWKGAVVEVIVEEEGFCWDGKTYASLSAAATAIAGTRWNGPRFFGLREKAP
ncbi:DUF2924 domain-containing protein [Parasphingopyxis marina]|uniref:DUF2924 domain-containing protein n=1 Tax=Parasphingopyxis marina TaxID=2761622 RepID=A0A842HS02_9SPHN|nr:DUF2924 domain-containing protein [Parasphingopyxis marina]MBC2776608.1 DUF2924 domain-containing protein [Parasphingopyxis marina]